MFIISPTNLLIWYNVIRTASHVLFLYFKIFNMDIGINPPTQLYRNTAISNTAASVKSSSGRIYGLNIINPNLSAVYLKFFNATAAGVVVGTTTPHRTFQIPGSGSLVRVPRDTLEIFSTAISIAAVTGLADNNTTAPGSPLHVEINYK